jgi:hypothetical protein
MKPIPDNTGKVHTRPVRGAGATALTLNLSATEALGLKAFIDTLRLRGDKIPSMSLIARRAVQAYLIHVQFSYATRAAEVDVLEKMATPYSNRTHLQAGSK